MNKATPWSAPHLKHENFPDVEAHLPRSAHTNAINVGNVLQDWQKPNKLWKIVSRMQSCIMYMV